MYLLQSKKLQRRPRMRAGDGILGAMQCRINHGADGARAGGPPVEGPPEQIFLQRQLVVGCTAPHGTCLSLLRKALPKSEVGGE